MKKNSEKLESENKDLQKKLKESSTALQEELQRLGEENKELGKKHREHSRKVEAMKSENQLLTEQMKSSSSSHNLGSSSFKQIN